MQPRETGPKVGNYGRTKGYAKKLASKGLRKAAKRDIEARMNGTENRFTRGTYRT